MWLGLHPPVSVAGAQFRGWVGYLRAKEVWGARKCMARAGYLCLRQARPLSKLKLLHPSILRLTLEPVPRKGQAGFKIDLNWGEEEDNDRTSWALMSLPAM